jgi:hypothetical protein
MAERAGGPGRGRASAKLAKNASVASAIAATIATITKALPPVFLALVYTPPPQAVSIGCIIPS